MPGSPFRRRPAATRTYGSSRPSAAAPALASDAVSLNPRRTSAHAPKSAHADLDDSSTSSSDDDDAVAASLGARTSRPPPSPAPAPAPAPAPPPVAPHADGKRPAASTQGGAASGDGELELVAAARPARKTRSLGAAAARLEDAPGAGGRVVWDETAALAVKPAPRRRASARLAAGADAVGDAVEASAVSPAKRRSLAPVAADDAPDDSSLPVQARAPPKKRARLSAPLPSRARAAGRELEEDVPAPLDYVPLAERLKRATLDNPTPSAGDNAPPVRRTRSTSRAVGTASPPPPAAAPALAPGPTPAAPPRPSSPLRRTSAAAAVPRAAPPLRHTASSTSRPSAPAPAAGSSKPVAKQKPPPLAQPNARPPSPAKDLSAIFSRFAPVVADKGGAEAGEAGAAAARTAGTMKPRMMLKRSATTGSAADGGAAGDKGPGAAATDDEDDFAACAPASPTRRTLDRMHSNPTLPSSPLASPARVAALGGSLSFPTLGSPSRTGGASPNPFSRESSPSPARTAAASASSAVAAARAGAVPALGSAYRPLAFAPPASTAFASAAGPTRTYAGGARTVRRDVDEEALFAAPAAHPSSSAASSSASTSTSALPKLPPALSGRTRPAGAPAAAPQQDLTTLRALWGIDAEDALADSEEADSQDRGSRVVGGGLLRKQGEGKRWMDEMGWCLEGLRDGERSAARASALDLLNKLLSRDWLRRLKSSGQAETVYLAFRLASSTSPSFSASSNADQPGPDRVLDTAFAVLLALLMRDQRMAEPLCRLRAADVAREAAKRRAPQGDDDGGEGPSQVHTSGVAQSDGDIQLRSEASAGWWSSSPRKAGRVGGGAEDDGVDEDRCDLLEVLRDLGEREWVGEEIGTATREDEAGGAARAKGKKALRGDARHSLRDIIDSADLFPSSDDPTILSSPVTLQALVLAATRSITSFAPRAIFQPQHMVCESGVFGQVVQVFVDECAGIEDRVTKYEKGLDLLPPPVESAAVGSIISLSSLSTCLSIFEATSLATPYAFHLISSPNVLPHLASALEDLTLFTFLLALDPPASTDSPADPTRVDALGALTAVLGILFGLTTESAWGVPLVADGGKLVRTLVRVILGCRRAGAARQQSSADTTQLVRSATRSASAMAATTSEGDVDMTMEDEEEDDDEPAGDQAVWDILSLALGVLANLAESADEDLRERVRELLLSSSCYTNRKCARECQCALVGEAEPSSALEILARLALDPLADSPNSVYHHSITGFLRLLLGLLVLDSPQNEEIVLAALSHSASAIAPILDALEELASLHDDQRRAQDELALPAPGDKDDDDLAAESQRTEVDETQLDENDVSMDEVGVARNEESEGEGLPKRMRELVQRLRRRIS
ncbi:uncharacterized protein RHOBADRAFT_53982 [Rhodotorula graminis WP1]|uniref:Wings apart-like protein C-terminal domain-containing protein n=1 Tax=Rhodotorula graminis (strain WP1) TaxID=578459 RepID=A0A194S3B9_RHOGW|nr:uncharacterized protein RHOBADRAFT_53982 [Rhodotorula graminis WP1]KPV75087.1 hypothetical protein RHOBADRAFT_53982 [Rhodotorula graminis WP1]